MTENNDVDSPYLFQPADTHAELYSAMKTTIPTFIVLSIIGIFSCIHHENVSLIYNILGASVGLGPPWVKTHTIEISNYGHMIAYCLLFILLSGWQQTHYLKSSVIVLIVAGGFEVIQLWIPLREADFKDLGYNMLGILFGYILLISYKRVHNAFICEKKRV